MFNVINCSYCSEDKPRNTWCLKHYYPDNYCSRECWDHWNGLYEGAGIDDECLVSWCEVYKEQEEKEKARKLMMEW